MIFAILGFIIGIAGMIALSPLVTDYSVKLGKVYRISSIVIGLMIAIGTNLPEFSNSVISSFMGYDGINLGNLLGSSLSLFTLSIGAVVLIRGGFKVERKNLLILFACSLIILFQLFTIFENKLISRINGAILIGNFALIYFIINNSILKKEYLISPEEKIIFSSFKKKYFLYLALSLAGIILCSYILVNSIIFISEYFNFSRFIFTFFIVSIATTLPEFFIGIDALKKGEYELFLGDQFGSIISNLTLILGISAIISEKPIIDLAVFDALNYIILSFILVFSIMILNKKIDRKLAIMLVGIYFASIFFIVK